MAAYGNMEKGLPGLLFGLTNTHTIDSRLASGVVPFGAVVEGVGDGEQCKVLSEGKPFGVAVRTALDRTEYKDKDSVNVLREGKVWVTAGETIEADKEVAFDTATGKFVSKPASTTAGKVELGWFARSSASEGELVLIEVTING